MIFKLFLWLLAWRLRLKLFLALRKDAGLQQFLTENDLALQVQTIDQKAVRCFIIRNGKFNSFSHALDQDNVVKVSFKDGKNARNIISELRKDKSQIFAMIQEQKIIFEGDFSVLQKFFALKERLDQASLLQ
jgi:hypothetical protein